MNELTGQVALVTGASRGIGAATARELAGRGASVLLAARTVEACAAIAVEIRDGGGQADAIACDVARYADLEAAAARCQDVFGRLDILINNAAVVEPIARIADSDPDAWSRAADINAKGVYYGLRAALPAMVAQGAGVIVNISSGAAVNPLEGWSAYCAGKAAALALTRCADLEYRDAGVRIVGLSPGTVATEMQVKIKASGINPISRLDASAHIPAATAARAIAWLCGEDAADFAGIDVNLRDPEIRRRAGLA